MFCMRCAGEVENPVNGLCPRCQAAPGAVEELAPVGFWVRFAAYCLDTIILTFAGLVIVVCMGLLLSALGMGKQAWNLASLSGNVAGVVYFIAATALYGQTLGKRLCGVKVVMSDGSPVSWGGSALRYVGYIVNMFTLGLGFVWVGVSSEKRGLHDLIGGTRVVYAEPGKKASAGLIVGIILGVLLCLMVVLGIAAAIAIPKFAELIRKSGEGATKGNLGALRASLSIYYGDKEGVYPTDLLELTEGGKYLAVIPKAKTPNYHVDSPEVRYIGRLDDQAQRDAGGWGYVNDPESREFGKVFVNCTHTDSKGVRWDSY